MRTQFRPAVPMVLWRSWVSCFLLAWGMLPAVQATSLRRVERAGEIVITLPQSLLLQSSDGEQQGNAQGKSSLWNAVQEGAKSVVEDAREAFFAESKNAQAQKVKVTTPAPTTTTAMTTVDPTILAKQLKITKEAAQARNLLVGMINRAQIGLLTRLKDINGDLEATELRAQQDLQAVNHSAVVAANMPIMVSNADVDVKKIETNGEKLKAALPGLVGRAAKHVKLIGELMREKKALESNLLKSKKLPGAKSRIQNNLQTMGALIPRLEKLERRVTKLEAHLYDGDIKKLVDDTASTEVTNVMEDVSRGFGRFVANPK